MNITTLIGIVAGILTAASSLPQLIKIIKEKKVEDLSAGMFITLLAGIIIWVVYGVLKHDWPIILTNAFSVLLNVCILILRWRFKGNK